MGVIMNFCLLPQRLSNKTQPLMPHLTLNSRPRILEMLEATSFGLLLNKNLGYCAHPACPC